MHEEESRIYLFDNLKAVLIALVVFGHAIEPILIDGMKIIYIFIYIFHMPLFVFCSGYLSKYNPKKIISNLIYTYILFQFIYCLGNKLFLDNETLIQFTTPYWIMWYLMALIIWNLVLPLVEVVICNKKGYFYTICLAFILGIVSGFNDDIGYFMSFSRIIYYFPFFIIGFCIKKTAKLKILLDMLSKQFIKYLLFVLTTLIILLLFLYYQKIDLKWLYGSYSYHLDGYFFTIRIFHYLFAIIISLLLIAVLPKKKAFFSNIGQKSFQIYILHGFIVQLIAKYAIGILTQNQYFRTILCFIVSVLITYLLSLLSFPFF